MRFTPFFNPHFLLVATTILVPKQLKTCYNKYTLQFWKKKSVHLSSRPKKLFTNFSQPNFFDFSHFQIHIITESGNLKKMFTLGLSVFQVYEVKSLCNWPYDRINLFKYHPQNQYRAGLFDPRKMTVQKNINFFFNFANLLNKAQIVFIW